MFPFLLLAALAGPPDDPSGSKPAPAASDNNLVLPTITETKLANGLVFGVDIREEYLAGSPLLVELTVRNESSTILTFPDLAARPFLVHFRVTTPKGARQERFNTPPAQDPGNTWTIAPAASRRVLLEVPLSYGFDPGSWSLGVEVQDGQGAVLVAVPARAIRLSIPSLKAGHFTWDNLVSGVSGAAMAWLHGGSGGYDLYLSHFDPKLPTRVLSHSFLGRLNKLVDPYLSRTRASDSNNRYVYWQQDQSLRYLRLDGGSVRINSSFTLPYPNFSLLGEGVTGSDGALLLPIWVPAPTGEAGSVKVLEIDVRGPASVRTVVDLPARPYRMASGLDAAGNLLFGMAHGTGLDLYRVDPTWEPTMPARGVRVLKAEGMQVAWLGWDVLPDQGEKAGGLTLSALLLGQGETGATYRYCNAELGGKLMRDSGILLWQMPGNLVDLLPRGIDPFRAISKDAEGNLWYLSQGQAPIKSSGRQTGVLFHDSEGTRLRVLGAGLYSDSLLGP